MEIHPVRIILAILGIWLLARDYRDYRDWKRFPEFNPGAARYWCVWRAALLTVLVAIALFILLAWVTAADWVFWVFVAIALASIAVAEWAATRARAAED